MSTREENYAKHLQSLSDKEFDLLCTEYPSITSEIIKLINVSETINKLREEKFVPIQKEIIRLNDVQQNLSILLEKLVNTPHEKSRILYYTSEKNKTSTLLDNFVVVPDNDMCQKMSELIYSLFSMSYTLSSSELIENKLGIPRKFLIGRELARRQQEYMQQKNTYIDQCIAFLIADGYFKSGKEVDYSDEELISKAHIRNLNNIGCDCNPIPTSNQHCKNKNGEMVDYFIVSPPRLICRECCCDQKCIQYEVRVIPYNIVEYESKFNLDYNGKCPCRYVKI
jgi:hypothetical protein